MIKPEGIVFIIDFSYVDMPKDNFWAGNYTKKVVQEKHPEIYEKFYFIIDKAPNFKFEIFNIPFWEMMRCGYQAGFHKNHFIRAYVSEEN